MYGVFLSICSKIAFEIPKEFRRVGIRANYQKSMAARYGKRLNIRPLISPNAAAGRNQSRAGAPSGDGR